MDNQTTPKQPAEQQSQPKQDLKARKLDLLFKAHKKVMEQQKKPQESEEE